MSIAPERSNPAFKLAAATFAILVLELAMIRWLTTQIRVAAYFANLVLLASFLGMGLGVGLARHAPRLGRWSLPALAGVCVLLACASPLGLIHVRFPDLAPTDWGMQEAGTWLQFFGAAMLVTACFWATALIFLLPGTVVGALFQSMPPLKAYGADLAGSLAGVIAMAAVAALWSPPPVWIALGALPLLWLYRDRWSIAAAIVAVAAAAYSIDGARFSPYNRIDLAPNVNPVYGTPASGATEWQLQANRDYYQHLLDLRPGDRGTRARENARLAYELPFSFSTRPGRSAIIVGAGTGNDVSAALRRGFARVVSIDIDPAILQIGFERHPEHPYSDPRAVRINDDARAYFGRSDDGERFDVVCYGLLDSRAMFSSMTSLRLDNFVFTREGIAAAWARVSDDGVLSISFTVSGPWIYQRMVGMVRQATSIDPIIVTHGYDSGATILAGRHISLEAVQRTFPAAYHERSQLEGVAIPNDNWPFLYLRSVGVPWTYIAVFVLVGLTAAFAVRGVFGRSVFSRGRFDWQMFLLGAGFMLLETRAVTQLSLLFGSTWIVNTSVFAGVLIMVLLANLVAGRLRDYRRALWYSLLAVSLLLLWLLPLQPFFALGLSARALAAGPLVAIPVFFAGVIFSSELRVRADAASALGCNLCGAMLGGLLENLSMIVGLKSIVLLALAIYLGSLYSSVKARMSGT